MQLSWQVTYLSINVVCSVWDESGVASTIIEKYFAAFCSSRMMLRIIWAQAEMKSFCESDDK